VAERLIALATASPAGSWRAWNARGVLADRRGAWDEADAAYAKAFKAAGNRPEILNNHGWSLLARGRWRQALDLLDQAARLDPRSARIANNLELARAALSEDLPRRLPGEGDSEWAARLNDAGVLARVGGDRKRAIAAFAQAIVARHRWFERAANNLALAEDGK
jgi:tetratricopeptide (TPR) repeat protein